MLAIKDCHQMDARLARRDAGITHVAFRGQRLAAAFHPRNRRSEKPPEVIS
jgi:hypothetical protein